jgi:hypothetical protein
MIARLSERVLAEENGISLRLAARPWFQLLDQAKEMGECIGPGIVESESIAAYPIPRLGKWLVGRATEQQIHIIGRGVSGTSKNSAAGQFLNGTLHDTLRSVQSKSLAGEFVDIVAKNNPETGSFDPKVHPTATGKQAHGDHAKSPDRKRVRFSCGSLHR